ncbi:MAG TPA: hypothetical protein VK669_12420 [Candidatus Limnocylindrales bacterium]|nr:hypothetical protein [Candidatus Limnocylindrales bacterium]
MRRSAFAALAALFFASTALAGANPASTTFAGRWAITSRSDDPSRVQLRLEYSETSADGNSNSSWSSGVPIAEAGLPIEKLRGPIGPVSFTIQREPGTFNCTGSAGEGSAAGQFTYAQNPRFDDALASRGLGRPTLHQSLELAISGTTLAFVDQIRALGGRSTIADVVRVVEHGATPKYIADLASLGYRVTSLDQVVRLRDHGVTTEFVRAVQAAGYRNLSPDDLVRLADHGVRERYIADMRAAGYTQVSADQLVTLRDHGVTPRYIGELAGAGYKNLSAEDLIALRDHGVTVSFVERLKAHGYTNVSVHDLIRLRDAGI